MTVGIVNNWPVLGVTGRVDLDALTVDGVPITANGATYPITAVLGGTGQIAYTTGDTLYSSATNVLSKLTVGATGNVLTVAGGVPTWAAPATSGTVTTVSVSTANGVSGIVATATSTPAITLTLGAITPTSVAATTTLLTSAAPATASSAGTAGTITWDATHVYVCIADSTWVRADLATW